MRALLARFPGLAASLPHVDLGVVETPVETYEFDGTVMRIKRDDLSSPLLGGNKVRALELLLAHASAADTLLTVGAAGSTHALAVAQYGSQLGAEKEVITWPQEWSDVSRATAQLLKRRATVDRAGSPLTAYLRVIFRRLRRRAVWIPAGGSSPLGALAHASAALELVGQLQQSQSPLPDEVVLPLGSGGTTAGLLLGFAIAGVPIQVIGVRVVPRIVANRVRVLGLARRARRLLVGLTGEVIPRINASALHIVEDAYGGAYGRETPAAVEARKILLDEAGVLLDGTYSAKAFAVARARARGNRDRSVLFWLTFDGRWLDTREDAPRVLRSTSKRR